MNQRRISGAATVGTLLFVLLLLRIPAAPPAAAQPAGGAPKHVQNDFGGFKRADNRGGSMRISVLLDIKQIPVGSWAEYAVSHGGRPPRTIRHALVARDNTSATIEVIRDVERGKKGPLVSPAKKVTRIVVDLDLKEIAPKEIVVQRADADPVALANVRKAGQRIFKLDPTKSLGRETVTVAAGTFQTEHHREVGPRGDTVDIWASKQAPPFGMVKMERTPSASAPIRRAALGAVTYALVRVGTDAQPTITKPVKR